MSLCNTKVFKSARRSGTRWWCVTVAAGMGMCARGASVRPTANPEVERRPNIVILESDDHHFQALGCMGDPVLTPHIDALAARGVLFRNNICQGTACSPSRNSLITGSYPHSTGIYHNRDGNLSAGVWTFPQALQRAGYTTALIGKDHFKPAAGDFSGSPLEIKSKELKSLGFDYVFGMGGKVSAAVTAYVAGEDPYQDYLHDKGLLDLLQKHYRDNFTSFEGRRGFTASVLAVEHRQDAFIAGRAAEWIAAHPRDRPFFLWVEFVDPHPPADPPEPYASMYNEEAMRPPIGNTPHSKLSVDHLRRFRAGYYAMVSALDAQVGRIVGALDASGDLDSTVIIFTGDQGSMLGDHGLWGKGDYRKGSVNSPLVIAGPAKRFTEGQVIDRPVELLDLSPTILELAGADEEDRKASRGESLLPLLTGQDGYRRTLAFAEEADWQVAVSERYKYVRHPETPVLYDLVEDPDEQVNLAGQRPEVEEFMRKAIETWLHETQPVREPNPKPKREIRRGRA